MLKLKYIYFVRVPHNIKIIYKHNVRMFTFIANYYFKITTKTTTNKHTYRQTKSVLD